MQEYVLGFIFNKYNEVLLMLRDKPSSQAGKLNGIGGHIEEGETPYEAMYRETWEEVESEYNLWWRHAGEFYGKNWKIYVYYSTTYGRVEPKEGQTLLWYDRNELPSHTMYNLQWLIPLCREKIVFSINEENYE